MIPTKWYGSKRVAEASGLAIAELLQIDGVWMLMLLRSDVEVHAEYPTIFRSVEGRSLKYIDRLARDWIGHGIAPCQNGARGVGMRLDCCGLREVSASSRVLYGALHPSECIHVRWKKAEARANRVVRGIANTEKK